MANSDNIRGSDSKSDVKSKSSGSGGGQGASGANNPGPPIPKDGQVMVAIMKDMGIVDYEPKVINQLLEFAYRYVTNVLEDSKVLSHHARKKAIDIDDVKLAVQMYTEQNMTTAPSREMLLEQARVKNRQPLPIPRPTCGLRLPPDRHCFTACNYRLKYKPKPRPPGYGMSAATKIVTAPAYKPQTQQSKIMNQNATTGAASSPYAMKANVGKAPVFKINANPPQPSGSSSSDVPMPKIQIQPQTATGGAPAQFKIQINPQGLPAMKRKADEMDTGTF